MLMLLVAAAVRAADADLSEVKGHPRARFPLSVWTQRFDDALGEVVPRVLEDWNALTRETFDVTAFVPTERRDGANITIAVAPPGSRGLMGQTMIGADKAGVITLPIQITILEPTAPTAGALTSREALLYLVVAHELGHALGLPHVHDPSSLMCCVRGSVDFNEPVARDAYVDARRHPDVRSVRAQLSEHYERFWMKRR